MALTKHDQALLDQIRGAAWDEMTIANGTITASKLTTNMIKDYFKPQPDPIGELCTWLTARLPQHVAGWSFYVSKNAAYTDTIRLTATTMNYQAISFLHLTKPDPNPPADEAMLEFMDMHKVPHVERSRGELLHEMLEFCAYEQEVNKSWIARQDAVRQSHSLSIIDDEVSKTETHTSRTLYRR